MGIIQTIIAALGLSVPKLATGDSTIAVTVLFASDELGALVMNEVAVGDFEHVVEAIVYKSPTTQYPRGIRVDHAKTRALIGYVMPSNWDKAHKLLDYVASAQNGASRVRMDCSIFGVRSRSGAEVFSIDLQFAEPLQLL
jgi:hypothetical protein